MVGAICHYDVTSEKGTQGARPRKVSSLSRINLNLVHKLMLRGDRGNTMTMDTQVKFPHPRLDWRMGLQDPI